MFDSGIGGLALFREITQLIPNQTIYYLADSAHFPYGDKSREEIIGYCQENVSFLLNKEIKLLVVACVTATCMALDAIVSLAKIPVYNVVDPLVDEVKQLKGCARVALLGTRATIASGFVQQRLIGFNLHPLICSDLIAAVEQGDNNTLTLLKRYGEYFVQNGIDTVVLACTHFSHLVPLMKETWGEQLNIIDGTRSTALKIASVNHVCSGFADHRFFTTGDQAHFESQLNALISGVRV